MVFTICGCVIAACVALIAGIFGSIGGREGGTWLTYSLLWGEGTLIFLGYVEKMLT